MPSIDSSQFTATVTTAIDRYRPDWILPPLPRVDKAATTLYGYRPAVPNGYAATGTMFFDEQATHFHALWWDKHPSRSNLGIGGILHTGAVWH